MTPPITSFVTSSSKDGDVLQAFVTKIVEGMVRKELTRLEKAIREGCHFCGCPLIVDGKAIEGATIMIDQRDGVQKPTCGPCLDLLEVIRR